MKGIMKDFKNTFKIYLTLPLVNIERKVRNYSFQEISCKGFQYSSIHHTAAKANNIIYTLLLCTITMHM